MPSGGSTKFQTWFSYMDTIADFMAYGHFDGVRAHHSVFACSWFIIVQQQFFVIKSFIWSQSQPDLRGSIGTSIFGTTILCRHGSSEICGRLRNYFRRCATLLILLRFNNHIEFYCPPTKPFTRNSFSKNMPLWATNTFAFGSMVEGLPSSNPGITYKDIYPILVVNLFTYATHTKI